MYVFCRKITTKAVSKHRFTVADIAWSGPLCLLFFAILLLCCQTSAAADDNTYSGVVIETMNTAGYTYVRIDTGSEKVWAVGPSTNVKKGEKVSISRQMPMANYHSKSLDRDFEVLYFVGSFSGQGADSPHGLATAHAGTSGQSTGAVQNIRKAEGGKSIAEIMDQQKQLAGQRVRVRGKVIKYNPNIMGKDWIHIRDSSTKGDLTITGKADVALGDVILAEGRIVLNKDFGYGYVYKIMMEDAKVVVEE